MPSPKLMITLVIVCVVATLLYVGYAAGNFSLASSASAKNPPAKMLEREMATPEHTAHR